MLNGRGGYGPIAITITPNGKAAYVTSGAVPCGTCDPRPPASTVTPINTATNTARRERFPGVESARRVTASAEAQQA
jgi:DNA-binding beta-propeller fold protein YncE